MSLPRSCKFTAFKHHATIATIIVLASGFCGCGRTVERAAVEGDVYQNNAPLTDGTITFQPVTKPASSFPASWTRIVNGKFELSAESGPGLGSCRVEIRSPRETARKVRSAIPDEKPNTYVRQLIESVAPRFNSESQLTVEVKPGKNRFSFRVE